MTITKLLLVFLLTSISFAAYSPVLPEAPRVYVDSTYPAQTGRTINVPAGGDLQGAIDQATGGDVITLQPGATYTGSFILRNKPISGFIVIRTATPDGVLPNPGTRVQPSDAPKMAKIMSPGNDAAFYTEDAAHHYRLVGLEITVSPTSWGAYNLILLNPNVNTMAQVPGDIIIDRCYIHGNAGQQLRRGIALNSYRTAVIDSYLSEIHDQVEAQGICGWNGPGPFKIVNNYIEAAGENIFFSGSPALIPNLVPSDIEVRGNYLTKKLSWNVNDPSFVAPRWSVKNLFELKSALRVIIDGNILENVWEAQQRGQAVLFTANTDSGPWARVEDIRFTNNIVRNVRFGIVVSATNDGTPLGANRILVKNNVFEKFIGSDGDVFWVLSGANDITFENNLGFAPHYGLFFEYGYNTNLTFRNNIVNYAVNGILGDTYGPGMAALKVYAPPVATIPDRITKNALVNNASVAIDPALYPPGNFFPATSLVGFTDLTGGNYRLLATSPYKNAGVDGKDIGPDFDALAAAMATTTSGKPAPPTTVDVTPPVISAVASSGIGTVGATITWNTDELADGQVEFGPTTAYNSSTPLSTSKSQQHTIILSGLLSNTVYQFRVRSKDAAGNLALSPNQSFHTLASAATAATFLNSDTATQGNWKGVYGEDGSNINGVAASLPSYAVASLTGAATYNYGNPGTDVRALQLPATAGRVKCVWYSSTSFSIDVNLNDASSHRVAIYFADYDNGGRAQTVDVVDAVTGVALNSQALSNFGSGRYLVWNMAGHVLIKITRTAGANAVASGILIGPATSTVTPPATPTPPTPGPAGTAAFLRSDPTTQGSWQGMYGSDGYNVVNYAAAYPTYAQVSFAGQAAYIWSTGTTDLRALQKPGGTDRIAATLYSGTTFTADVNITDGRSHQVSVYLLDYDAGSRGETVDVLDAVSGAVLDSRPVSGFSAGQYLSWNLSGHIKIRFTRTGGWNAVVSGVFFGGAPSSATTAATFLATDTTTKGNWAGTYGVDGYEIVNAARSYPAYVNVSTTGASSYTWAGYTTDARALQRPDATGRIQAAYFSWSNTTFDVVITDGNSHRFALYCVDYDGTTRSQTITVSDADTGNTLDTRVVTNFNAGQYLVWKLSGHVKVKVTLTGGPNEVVSGVFFGA
jgi:hypothetical protein